MPGHPPVAESPAAFAIAALAGMLIRRVVPTIVTTLAVYAGLAAAAVWLVHRRAA